MDIRKTMGKLEDSLTHFLISELCKADPTKRGSPEMYKYKGLGINVDPKSKVAEKTVWIRIGVLEAEFRLSNCEKNSGGLNPEEERLVKLWLQRGENSNLLKALFVKVVNSLELEIIPFDLEHFYAK